MVVVPQLAAERGQAEHIVQVERIVSIIVMVIFLADFAVPEPERRYGKLERQGQRSGPWFKELGPLVSDSFDNGGVRDTLEEIIEHDPLVMLSHQRSCIVERATTVYERVVGPQEGN